MKKLTLMAAAMLLSMMSFAQVNLTNGLLAYYPYTGNANDASGNGNNGTVNGPTLTADRFGGSNSAYSFSANTITANVPHNFDGDFSHNFWFKMNNTSMVSGILSWGDRFGTDYNSYSTFGTNAGIVYSALSESDDVNSCDLYAECSTNAAGNFDNNWHMATTVKTGTTLSLYIDTVLIASTNIADSCNNSQNINSFKIGNDFVGFHFTGNVDDIMLYDRALNAAERAYLFNITSTFVVTGTTNILELDGVDFFPNPIKNSLQLSFPTAADYQVRIFDAAGRQVATETIQNNNTLELNTTTWAAGLYAVQIRDNKGGVVVKKVTKL